MLILQRAVADAPRDPRKIRRKKKRPPRTTKNRSRKTGCWSCARSIRRRAAIASHHRDFGPVEVKRATGDAVSGGPVADAIRPCGCGRLGRSSRRLGAGAIYGTRFAGPVKDYASSADLHVVAWFELNRVPDGNGGEAPQYLVAGSRGGRGQACDFTMLRVYTWGTARKRYETAYVESDLCGRLPIRVSNGAKGPRIPISRCGRRRRGKKVCDVPNGCPPREGSRRPPSAHPQLIAGFSRTGFSLSGFDQAPDFLSTFPPGKPALLETRGNILLEKFARSLNASLPHGENKFRSDAMEISSRRSSCGIFPGFLRQSRESRAETAASPAV